MIITSSSDDKLAKVTEILKPLVRPGAAADTIQTINYKKTSEWDQEVAKLTGGRKVDHVIEISGRATLGKSIRSTRSGGLVAISGYLSDYAEQDPKVKEEGEHPATDHGRATLTTLPFRSGQDAVVQCRCRSG